MQAVAEFNALGRESLVRIKAVNESHDPLVKRFSAAPMQPQNDKVANGVAALRDANRRTSRMVTLANLAIVLVSALATVLLVRHLGRSPARVASMTDIPCAGDPARRASEGAGRGEEASTGMDEMGRVSRKTDALIDVIDNILFQTNLLALSAAMEAARAGEQGHGFAALARSMRGLAQRSAAAAEEIKGLISASPENVTTAHSR